jgi:hexosaminidase
MRLVALLLMLMTMFIPSALAQSVALMPQPAKYGVSGGQLAVDQNFSVFLRGARDARLESEARRFLLVLSRQTGLTIAPKLSTSPQATLVVQIDHASKELPELGEDESYTLSVDGSGLLLKAPTTLGALRGMQTVLQLVTPVTNGFAIPIVNIDDKPRFPWRGLMIDVSRHFQPLDVIRRNLDGMAAVKLNVFHWHLSDNQGFRVESKKFPKLHELGSDGTYYTQDEVRGIIAYAAERGIRVVPEFDMPGHSTAWFVGYPELASAPGPYEIERHWGIFDPAMDPTKESTYKFLDEFIGEMAKLFPDKFFHIGGDEVNGKQWDANPQIQAFMKSHKLKDNAALQTYFTNRVQKLVEKHGKTMIGWDEILNPDSPKTIVIQSWRGAESLSQAAKQGYRGLLSNGYYVDLNWPAARHYAMDPTGGAAASLSDEEKSRILGGEACMWSEFTSPENVDSRIWPRTAAIAERLWSPQGVTDVNSMYERMAVISARLDFVGLNHNTSYGTMLRRIQGKDDFQALRTLADVVEPVKDYQREQLAATPPTQSTPIIRLVDAARPESETARLFSQKVDAFLAGTADAASKADLRVMLAHWSNNQSDLNAAMSTSYPLQEAAPLSQNLSALGAAGLAAMDYLGKEQAPDGWKTQQLAAIEQAKKPGGAQLLIMVADSVEKMVQAVK